MDISVLREFLDLTRSLNYSASARRLQIAQSTLSKHVSSLEKEVGARLFVRDSHSVRLTSAGKVFASKISDVISAYDDAIEAVNDIRVSFMSKLDIGFIVAAPPRSVADACRVFKVKAPGVKLGMYPMEPEEVVQAVESGDIDLGITIVITDAVPRDMSFFLMERQLFGALVDNRHPIARKGAITMADLAGERLLIPSPASFPIMGSITSARLLKAFPNIDIAEETHGLAGIGPLLTANNYVALTYNCTLRFFKEGYTFVPLTDIDIQAAIGMIRKDSRENEAIDLFSKCLCEVLFSDKVN
jgi:DNA-binding transcriptional LysR family regulator